MAGSREKALPRVWHSAVVQASTTAGIVLQLNLPQLSIVTTHDYLKADPECTKKDRLFPLTEGVQFLYQFLNGAKDWQGKVPGACRFVFSRTGVLSAVRESRITQPRTRPVENPIDASTAQLRQILQ